MNIQQALIDSGFVAKPKSSRLLTPEEAREALKAAGVSITQWAIANKFSPNLVFEVLGQRKKCVRGQAHNIAVKLGLKDGTVTTDPANVLNRVA